MKKNLINILVFVILFVLFLPATSTMSFAEDTRITVNSLNISNARPETINGVVYIPLRSFFEALEWRVEWEPISKEVICTQKNEELRFKTERNGIEINRIAKLMDAPLININNRSYLPQKFVTKQFGIKVRWNKKDNIIITSDNDTSSVTVNGGNNIVIVGDCMIINIFEPCSINTLNDMVSYSDRLLSSNAREALNIYKEILENISAEEAPDIFAHVMNNSANAYSKLAEYGNTKDNITNAIECYSQAMPFYKDNNDVLNYSILLNNLGSAYRVLADITGENTFLEKAVDNYIEASDFYIQPKYPLDYSLVQYNLAKVYSDLGQKDLSIECCLNSKVGLEKTLSQFSLEQNPSFYAMLQYNLGDIEFMMETLDHEKRKDTESLLRFKEAQKVWTAESYPFNYAKVNQQFGYSYTKLYEHSGDIDYLYKAKQVFEEALEFYTIERYPFKYGVINLELGNVYTLLSQLSDKDMFLSEATLSFENSLKVFNSEDYPKYLSQTASQIDKLK